MTYKDNMIQKSYYLKHDNLTKEQIDLMLQEGKKVLAKLPWYKCIIPRIVWRMYLTVGNITQYKWFNKQFTYKNKRVKY